MIPTSIATCLISASPFGPSPILWLDTNGGILLSGKDSGAAFYDRVDRVRTPNGIAYDFSGPRSAIRFPDLPVLHLSGSMTVAVWIFPRRYGMSGFGSQVLFRGDDRPGLDPYYLRLEHDGRVHFSIQNERNEGCQVSAPVPLQQWSRITANFDVKTGRLEMWVNDARVATATTTVMPLKDLDPNARPGFGVGNINDGVYNQPFDGLLADVRLYSAKLAPRGAGFTSAALHRLGPVVRPETASNRALRD